MRPLIGADIIDFHNGHYELLVLTDAGVLRHIDASDIVSSPYDNDRVAAYDYVVLDDDTSAQVLLERSTIDNGEWFEDALDEDASLASQAAEEMAAIINQDGVLPGRVRAAQVAADEAEKARIAADEAALRRAKEVDTVVAYCKGNQSEAARRIGIDQAAVHRLVKKWRAHRPLSVGDSITVPADAVPED